jgi:two-component system alkaline phosphatase synthesis response regulator PhoP
MSKSSKQSILVIEDDALFADIYASKLGEAGFEVHKAQDGETGWALLTKHRPDVVLLDLLLPKISGIDFMAKIRGSEDKKVREVPVIVVTNLNEHSFADDIKKHGVHAYFLKSDVIFSQILDKIREILSGGK